MLLARHVISWDHVIKEHSNMNLWAAAINLSYHPAKFDCHKHSDSGDMLMFLVCYVILTWWHHQHLLDYSHLSQLSKNWLLTNFVGDRSHGNGDINFYMNSETNTFEKAELTTSACNIDRFSKSIITIYNSKVSDSSGRKLGRNGEEKHRQLQSVMHFTQTQ